MKKQIARLSGFIVLISMCLAGYGQKEIYELVVYKMKTNAQVNETDIYLKDAFLPAMHRLGIKQIGVFKPISNDTAGIKQIIVLVPYISVDIWRRTKQNIELDPVYTVAAKGFIDADTGHYPFIRMETSLMEAFPDHPKLIPTQLKSHPDAVYEMRSYESPSEELHRTKVEMFNAGGEIKLFKRLDFQAVFYADVLTGNHMPNLVYMVVFTDTAARTAHWKSFGASTEWQTISVDPLYRNNISVNHIESTLMHRTLYSDL